MAYNINENYVYLSSKKWKELNEIALKDKDSVWQFKSHIEQKKAGIADQLRKQTLEKFYEELSFDVFYNEWVYFKFDNKKDISSELWDLLEEYKDFNPNFRYFALSNNDKPYDDLLIPPEVARKEGRPFEIAIFKATKSKKRFSFLYQKKMEKVFSLICSTQDIISIQGRIDEFEIVMNNKIIYFRKNFIEVVERVGKLELF